jgi:hypothetical protein
MTPEIAIILGIALAIIVVCAIFEYSRKQQRKDNNSDCFDNGF